MSNWYGLETHDVLHRLNSSLDNGLDAAEAERRLSQHGPNQLIEKDLESPWVMLWKQFTATMVLILIFAAILSAIVGDYREAIAIMAIVVFNGFLGFKQEYQAEQAMAALKQLAVPIVRVRRNGNVREISAQELVPGDIVVLEAGNIVPADGRLIESSSLRIQESSLTGESESVDKISGPLEADNLPLGDQLNMAHMGTTVTYGRGMAVVTSTGMETELGKIAAAIQTVPRQPTQLQQRLDQLGRRLAIAIFILITIIFALGLSKGEELRIMFLTAVSLGVAAVPEGLPAVVTISLSLGAKRMFKRHALIRKLPAVETLGSVTIICSDKTGTLTENRMTVTSLSVADHCVDLTEYRRELRRDHSHELSPAVWLSEYPSMSFLVVAAALCSDAVLDTNAIGSQDPQAIGEPTEAALVNAAAQLGFWKAKLEQGLPRVHEIPFDSERKCMTTLHQFQDASVLLPITMEQLVNGADQPSHIAFTKGAFDCLVSQCDRIFIKGRITPLTEEWLSRIRLSNDQLAENGMRVLSVAFQPFHNGKPELDIHLENHSVFLGNIALIDPVRAEATLAVETCKSAGIRPIMITGDHPLTALKIAHDLNIAEDKNLLTGQRLETFQTGDWTQHVNSVSVFARVSPQHKLKIVQALQSQGHIVAMTGDGVNDAPALKQANIGVAMGITGTDVAKEAADMVLLDDNFATIVAAVREGRVIYDNIRKFIKYVLTGNCGELWAIILAPFLGMPLLLLPLQILWINLIADGLLALALSGEKAENRVMQRPPYRPDESIFGRGVGRDIFWIGLLLGMILLVIGYRYWSLDQTSWQTLVFSTLAFSRIAMALTMRSERDSLFRIGLMSNKTLIWFAAMTFSFQVAIIYVPGLQRLFATVPLSGQELSVSLLMSIVVFSVIEFQKWLQRLTERQKQH